MLQYLVIVDMTKALKQLKAASIKVHNRSEVKMHVKAKDPDDACAVAIDKIYKDILKTRNSARVRDTAEKVKHLISIKKIRKASSNK